MRLVILGAGGHGQTIADLADQLGKYNKILFLDDSFNDMNSKRYQVCEKYEIVGCCDGFKNYVANDTEFYPAFGNNELRLEWEEKIECMGGKLSTIIHPSSYVSPSVEIKAGTVVLPMAIINTGCTVGKACIINIGAIVDHGCIIEDGCHINAGAIVMPENRIAKLTKIDSGFIVKLQEYPI